MGNTCMIEEEENDPGVLYEQAEAKKSYKKYKDIIERVMLNARGTIVKTSLKTACKSKMIREWLDKQDFDNDNISVIYVDAKESDVHIMLDYLADRIGWGEVSKRKLLDHPLICNYES